MLLSVGLAHGVFRLAAKLPDEATVFGCGNRGWPTPTPRRASNVAAWERATVELSCYQKMPVDERTGLAVTVTVTLPAWLVPLSGPATTPPTPAAAMTMAAMPRRMRRDFFGSLEDAWGVMGSTQPVNALVRITNLGK